MSPRHILIGLSVYTVLAYLITGLRWPDVKRRLFTVLNIVASLLIYQMIPAVGLAYVTLVVLHFFLAHSKASWALPLGVALPIAFLFLFRAVPSSSFHLFGPLPLAEAMVGFSYMAFRLSLATTEINQGVVSHYDVWDYLSFAFFSPTLAVGPISRLSTFLSSSSNDLKSERPSRAREAFWRIGAGLVKYLFVGVYLSRTAFSGLLAPGGSIGVADIVFASISYYLFLYANFSGFCDIAVGIGILAGIEIDENFNAPLSARNIQDFWNRWHMTLSSYIRVILFTPLCQFLTHAFGTRYANAMIPVALFASFLFIGIWHGTPWNYLAFGAIHGSALVICYGYRLWLKKILPRHTLQQYMANRGIKWFSVAVTFLFVSLSFIFFANSPAELREMFAKF